MQILSSDDFTGVFPDHPYAPFFHVLGFRNGEVSMIPKDCFINWAGLEPTYGQCFWGKACILGTGTRIRYDSNNEMLRLGNYVSGERNVSFILGGIHNSHVAGMYVDNFPAMPHESPDDTIVGNDVWIGESAMILGGTHLADGTVIQARSLITAKSKLEPYGIYAGSPAKLTGFRFDQAIIDLLMDIQWWHQSKQWIHEHSRFFQFDLTLDTGKSVEMLTELKHIVQA